MATLINRRTLLKGTVAGGALALAAPLYVRQALASSGTVNVASWGGYLDKNIIAAFESKTGIKLNLTTYGSNEEIESKMRAAGGKGWDLIFPSVDTRPEYDAGHLLAPIDISRVNVSGIKKSIWRSSVRLGAEWNGKRYLVPFDWGTEGITYDSSIHDFKPGQVSYGDLWKKGLTSKVAGRQKSLLISLTIYLDSIGVVPSNRGMDLYKSEADMRRIFTACLKWVKPHIKNIGAYWNNATEATAAFTTGGCNIGQTWDTTGIMLHKTVNKKWIYTAPKEGALGWMDTMAVPSGAVNIDQAYELINFLMTPKIGAMFANNTGYNSSAAGTSKYLTEASKEAYKIAYPAGAIKNLWWWPIDTPWFTSVRQEYVQKMTNL